MAETPKVKWLLGNRPSVDWKARVKKIKTEIIANTWNAHLRSDTFMKIDIQPYIYVQYSVFI